MKGRKEVRKEGGKERATNGRILYEGR